MAGMGGAMGANMAGGIGATVTTVAGIVQGAMRMKGAKEQARKAGELRNTAKYVPKEQLRPEYQQVRDAQQIGSNFGLNNISRYEQNIDNSVANMNRDAAALGSSGGASLAALSGAYTKSLDARNELSLRDSEMRQNKLNQLYATTTMIGDKQRDLELERQRKKELILAEASALDKAAMANKMGAHDVAANAIMQGAAMYAGSAMPNSSQASQPTQAPTSRPIVAQPQSYVMPTQQSQIQTYNVPNNTVGGTYGMSFNPNGGG